MSRAANIQVAALFVRADSIYKTMEGVDAWDAERDARNYAGPNPVVAHPPCRGWGRFRRFAKLRKGERRLAVRAVRAVRQFGGVLEHPAHSTLWDKVRLPKPGEFSDQFGGFSIEVEQFHWGHLAEKKTWLYIVGTVDLPPLPRRTDKPQYLIAPNRKKARDGRKIVSKKWREATPPDFAAWLVELARRCNVAEMAITRRAA